jgi:DNA-binding HxlR family transcriptional regulator
MGLKQLQESDRKIIRHLVSTDGETERVRKTHKDLDEEVEDVSTSWISQRLNYLVDEGFLEVEKEGRKKYYSLADDYSEILQLMDVKEQDAEFIRETPVEMVKSSSAGNISGFKMPGLTEYNRADRGELYNVEIDFEHMKDKLGDKPSAGDVILYAAKKNFEETEGVRRKLSKIYDEVAEETFDGEDEKKVLAVKEQLLDVLVENTRYIGAGTVEVTLPLETSKVTVKGGSLGEVYSSVPDNRVFPDVDSERLQNFLNDFEQKLRKSFKSAIVVRNF